MGKKADRRARRVAAAQERDRLAEERRQIGEARRRDPVLLLVEEHRGGVWVPVRVVCAPDERAAWGAISRR